MPVSIKLPTPLRRHADGAKTLEIEASSVGQALDALTSRYPALRQAMFEEDKLKAFVRVFVNSGDIADREGLQTPLQPGDTISILPPIAGA